MNAPAPPSPDLSTAPAAPACAIFVAALLGTLALRLAAVAILTRANDLWPSALDAVRWGISWDWRMGRSGLMPPDGVWLPGHSLLWGALAYAIPVPLLAIQTGTLAGHLLELAALGWLGWRAAGRVTAGAAAMAMAAVAAPLIETAHDAQVMPFAVAALAGGGACGLRAIRTPGAPGWIWGAAGGAGLFAAGALHFAAWTANALILVMMAFYAAGLMRSGARGRAARLAPVALGAVAFPALWAWTSARQFGNAWAFLSNQFAITASNWRAGGLTPEELLARDGAGLALAAGPLAALALAGWLAIRRRPAAGLWAPGVFAGAMAAALAALAWRPETALSNFRAPAPLHAALIVLTAGLAAPALERALTGRWRGAGMAAMAAAMLLWTGFNLAAIHRAAPRREGGVDHDAMAMAALLKQEYRSPQILPEYGEATRIGVVAPFSWGWAMQFRYLAGTPERFVHLGESGDPALTGFNGDYLLVRNAPAPQGWSGVVRCGEWALYLPQDKTKNINDSQ